MQTCVMGEITGQSRKYTAYQWAALCGWSGITNVVEMQPVWLKMEEKRDGFLDRTLLLDTIKALQTDMERMTNKV